MKLAYRILLIAIVLAACGSGAVLIGNLPGSGVNQELNVYDYYAGAKLGAVGFRSGPVETLLEQVTIRLIAFDLFNMGNTPLAPLVGLYSGTDTTITTLLAALNGPAGLAHDPVGVQNAAYTPTVAITLNPNTYYWLVLQGQTASTTKTAWAGTTNAGAAPGGTVGFTHLEYRGSGTTIGNMQTQSDKFFYYEIVGTAVTGGGGGGGGEEPPPGEVPEVGTMILIATGFILMRFRRWNWGQTA